MRRIAVIAYLVGLGAALTLPMAAAAVAGPAGCNSNYSPCVPSDPVDVDCASGTGDGPTYIDYRVQITGADPYGLDQGGEPGVGCENETGTPPTGEPSPTSPTPAAQPEQATPAPQTSAAPRFTG